MCTILHIAALKGTLNILTFYCSMGSSGMHVCLFVSMHATDTWPVNSALQMFCKLILPTAYCSAYTTIALPLLCL